MASLPSAELPTVAEAIAAGYQQPHTCNPFLWSSTLRETFNPDRCLSDAGLRRLSQWRATFSNIAATGTPAFSLRTGDK